MRGIILVDDIDKLAYKPAFPHQLAKDRCREDRRKRLMLKKINVIAGKFLLFREREMLEIYMYHNHRVRDLRPFVHSKTRYLVLSKMHHILYLLQQYLKFFFEYDYKEIDQVAREVLLPKQYIFLCDYLRLHSYRRCSLLYSISIQAVYCRLRYIKDRLQGKLFVDKKDIELKKVRKNIERARYVLEVTKPLVELITTLQRYRAKL